MKTRNQTILRAIEELRKISNAGLIDGDEFLGIFLKLKSQLQPEQSVSSSLTLEDLEFYDSQYYVGHIIDMEYGWVNQEIAELILLEYNAGVR
jgi:hypothetical protein